MELETAIKYALSGDAILFLGSGTAFGAINQNDEGFPLGNELANRLYNSCDDLNMAAEFFCEEIEHDNKDGKAELVSFLKKQFIAKEITPSQNNIPKIPWKRIYTTNYDNIVEKAYSNNGKHIKSLVLSDEASKYINCGETVYLHINGSIENLDKNTLDNEFKLTDRSYNTQIFNGDQWGKLFESDLKTYSTIIFIGFSMKYDLDIKRIVNRVNKEKCIFILAPNENEFNIKMLKKYGSVECIGLEGFFEKVSKIEKEFSPEESNGKKTYSNFEHIEFEPSLQKPSDTDVLAYYKTGKTNNHLYYPKDDYSYQAVIKRYEVEKIIDDIKSGIKMIFVHSDIGNGKSEVISQVCRSVCNNFVVYRLIDNNEKINKEIEEICKTTDKKIVVIENFFNYCDVFSIFELFNSNKNIIFIFSARTSIFKSRCEQFFSDYEMKAYDVNRLNDNEINQLKNIFDEYGFYPQSSISDGYEKYIKKNLNSKLQSIVLDIFNNEAIKESLMSILSEIESLDINSKNILLFMIISKVMNLDLNYSDIIDLLDAKSFDYRFENNNSIKELVDFKEEQTSIKSTIICVWMLKQLKDENKCFEILTTCTKQADIGYKVNKKYKSFLGNVISYKHLKFLLKLMDSSDEIKLSLLNNFYQEIKTLSYYNGKYFFWLQYGISALELNDFESAEHHFNAAKEKLGGESVPFEINNQYARLKLEIMLRPDYVYNPDTLLEFIEISKLLTPTSAKEDDEFYCYKMSSAYYPKIFEKFYENMNETEQNELKTVAKNNFYLCSKYLLKNKNESFINSVKMFNNTFEELSNYNWVLFNVETIERSYALGSIIINQEKKNAYIHISNISSNYVRSIGDYLSIGKKYKAKVLNFNETRDSFELIMK